MPLLELKPHVLIPRLHRRANTSSDWIHQVKVLLVVLCSEVLSNEHGEDVVESSVEVAELVILRSCRA